ncbi:hypothetical protein KUV41_15645 [Halomonas sp. DP8Y7-1]|uniref:hypothetical protein n=1 Tax=Halomonas sp. DP8Y7-1 TaxID=2859078 RepID=UPI001C9841A4|nr:hypothetical protein [Halomonas sp. DP8Y7-1]MBY6030797.1 hypothetical protein [Halomonas sp. DP8Y7-1]
MIVTLDFVCIRLHPESRAPEVLLRKREASPEPGSYGLVGGWIREQSQGQTQGQTQPQTQPQTQERTQKPGEGGDSCLDDAVHRILRDKVGLAPSYLEQVRAQGSLYRDIARGWSVTIPHLCLFNRTENDRLALQDHLRWASLWDLLDSRVPLPFDHLTLVSSAYQAFVNKIKYSSLLLYLLPSEVTIGEIVDAYATFGIEVKKQTVINRWIKAGLLEETGTTRAVSSKGPPARLFRLTEPTLSYFESAIGKSLPAAPTTIA